MEKIEDLFKLSNLIVNSYLMFICDDIYTTDLRRRENMIKQIRTLVIKEYNLIRLLPFSEIERYYSGDYKLDEDYQSVVFDRVNSKMMNLTDDYDSYIICGDELGIENIPLRMHLSIFDAIMSMLQLEAYKKLYDRIYSLNITCSQDEKFVSRLKEKLKNYSFESFYLMSTSEVIALGYDSDINKMPSIKREVIEKKLKSLKKDGSTKDFDETVDTFMKTALTRLLSVEKLENNRDKVFNYLLNFIQLEVVIDSYLSKEQLHSLDNYLETVKKDSNKNSVGMVKELIKRKKSTGK